MKRRVKFDDQDAVNRVAAAGYDLAAELSNPARDYTMRHILQARLDEAVLALTPDDRAALRTLAHTT